MLLADMKTLLTAIETTITMGEQPDSPDNVLTMYQNGGADPSHSFNAREFEEPMLQVIIRNKAAATAISKAEQVKDTLDGRTSFTVGSTRYISIFQQGDILPLGKDEKGRTELSLNFRVKAQR